MTPSRTWCGLNPVHTVGATTTSRVRQLGRAHGDGLDEQGVGADREVLAVLLERADGQEADRARAAPSARLDA